MRRIVVFAVAAVTVMFFSGACSEPPTGPGIDQPFISQDELKAAEAKFMAHTAKVHEVTFVNAQVDELQDGQAGWMQSYALTTYATSSFYKGDKDDGWVYPSEKLSAARQVVLVERHDKKHKATVFVNNCGPDIPSAGLRPRLFYQYLKMRYEVVNIGQCFRYERPY